MEDGEGQKDRLSRISPIAAALHNADAIAVPGTLLHMEATLYEIAPQLNTPLETEAAVKDVVKEEKRAALIRKTIIDVLETSKSITAEEAKDLREGKANRELRVRAKARIRSVMLHNRRRSPILPNHPALKPPQE